MYVLIIDPHKLYVEVLVRAPFGNEVHLVSPSPPALAAFISY